MKEHHESLVSAPKILSTAAMKRCKWDPNTYTNCDQVLTTHFHLNFTVDFNQSSLIGTNTIDLITTADNVDQVILDYQGINVNIVEQSTDKTTFKNVSYDLATGIYGNALIIKLASGKIKAFIVK